MRFSVRGMGVIEKSGQFERRGPMQKVLVSDILNLKLWWEPPPWEINLETYQIHWKFYTKEQDDFESAEQEKGEIFTCPKIPEAICWRKAVTKLTAV